MAAKKKSRKKKEAIEKIDVDWLMPDKKKEVEEKEEETAEEKEKKNKKSFLITLAVIAIIITLILAFVFGFKLIKQAHEKQQSYEYNAFTFRKTLCPGTQSSICWATLVNVRDQPMVIPFRYGPNELESIPSDDQAKFRVLNQDPNGTIFIAVEADADAYIALAGTELARILGDRYNILNFNTKGAVYGFEQNQINCDAANQTTLVLWLRKSKLNYIELENENCIVLNYINETESIKVANKFSYELLGIMK